MPQGDADRRLSRGGLARALFGPLIWRIAASGALLHGLSLTGYSADGTANEPVSIDRSLQQPFAEARSLVSRGRFVEAFRTLQPILNAPQNSLILLNDRYVDAKLEANRLIAGLPPSARAAYQEEFGRFARQELDRAKSSGRLESVLAISTAYRNTDAGRQALATVAGLYFDRGNFIEAAAVAKDLLDVPGSAAERSAAAARLVTAWVQLGEVDRARSWTASQDALVARHEIEIQGSKRRLDQWLDDRILAQSRTRTAPAPSSIGGHPQSVPSRSFCRPGTRFTWHKRLGGSSALGTLLDESVTRRAETGIAPLFPSVPLVVGQTLVVRRIDELTAYDLATGESRWSHDLSPSNGMIDGNSAMQSDSLPFIVEMLVDRAFSGGASSAISSDGERVFTIVEDVSTLTNPVFSRRGRRLPVETPPKNSLVAFDLRDGKKRWRLSEISPSNPSSSAEEMSRDVDFLGPPLARGGMLYVLARTDEGARLLTLDPHEGKVLWDHSLSGFSGFEADAVSSFGPACVPCAHDGLLLCPTPEGIVIAIDLVTRSCRWAYRAPPNEEPPRLPPRWGRRGMTLEARWIHAWRESVVRTDGDRCFFVSPRSRAIHALRVDTGERLWTRTVPDGLFLGPVVNGRLLAFTSYRALAFDTANGSSAWTTPVGLPSGRGFVDAGKYLLPQAEGGLAAIDVQTGTVAFPVLRQTPAIGNLVPLDNTATAVAAVAQSYDRLALLPSLETTRIAAAELVRRNPTDRDAVRKLALIEVEAGNFESAEGRLQALLDPAKEDQSKAKKVLPAAPAAKSLAQVSGSEHEKADEITPLRRELFQTLVADLDRNPARCGELEPRLARSAKTDKELTSARRAIANARLRRNERVLAFESLLELARLDSSGQIEIEHGPARVVGFDRSFRADLEDFVRDCSPDEKRQAISRLEQLAESSIKDGQTVVLQRLRGPIRALGCNPDLCERVDGALRPEPGLLQVQLGLWDATTGHDPHLAADAWRRLADLNRSRGDRRTAALCLRRLATDFGKIEFADHRRAADLVTSAKTDPRLAKEIDELSIDPWPSGKPDAINDSQGGSSAGFSPIALEIVAGSLCHSLDMAIDQEGKTLRFQGAGQSTYWDLPLPSEGSRFRGYLCHAWSIGPIVVVQVRTELFAVTPLDEAGEPNPKVLWHIDLLGPNPSPGTDLNLRFFRRGPGPPADRLSITDHLGRPVARVGPVLPTCICYNDRGTLVALDPLSGRLMWRRPDVIRADLATGDDAWIILVDRRTDRLEFIRSLDGKTIAERASSMAAGDLRWLEGGDAVIQAVEAGGTRLSRTSLFDKQEKWGRRFPAGTLVIRLDASRYAAAEPDGTLNVLAATTGATLASDRISGADHCLQIHATGDDRRFYIAFSTPFSDPDNFRANGMRDDSRNPLVNGMLCAVDRLSGRTLWARRFQDGVFAIDQSRVAPFLVFTYRHVGAGDEGGLAWPILHCIDKRTGRDIFYDRNTIQAPAEVFTESDVGRREVLLRLPESGIRFRYPR